MVPTYTVLSISINIGTFRIPWGGITPEAEKEMECDQSPRGLEGIYSGWAVPPWAKSLIFHGFSMGFLPPSFILLAFHLIPTAKGGEYSWCPVLHVCHAKGMVPRWRHPCHVEKTESNQRCKSSPWRLKQPTFSEVHPGECQVW